KTDPSDILAPRVAVKCAVETDADTRFGSAADPIARNAIAIIGRHAVAERDPSNVFAPDKAAHHKRPGLSTLSGCCFAAPVSPADVFTTRVLVRHGVVNVGLRCCRH